MTAGNYSRKVSYTAWDGLYSQRQETVCERFPTRRGTMVYIATGNWWRKVSYLTWGVWYTWRQETIRKGFPTRHGESGIHSDRKLFAKGFLFGVGSMVYIAAGNCLRKVSYLTWGVWYTCRQKTLRWEISRLRFAALEMTGWHGTDGIHCYRKLCVKGFLFGVGRMVYIATGNYSQRVSYTAWGEWYT